jgi:acetyl/propionyl-CoA carboxylase alpha subunit
MKLPVIIENDGMKGLVLRTATHTWIHMNGQTRCIEIQNKRAGKQQQQEKDPTRIQAPMPGKIIKVMCGAGDPVVPGQTLVVMEAMKMEYSLKSSITGTVASRPCVAGQQVALGDLLVQLKESQ